MNDAIARDLDLFTRVAETHPAIVRTLNVLISELDEACGKLDHDVQRELGDRLRQLGETVIARADRITVDGDLSEPI